MFESLASGFAFAIAIGLIVVIGNFLFSVVNRYVPLTKGKVVIGLLFAGILIFSGNDTLAIIGIIIYFIFAFILLGKFVFRWKKDCFGSPFLLNFYMRYLTSIPYIVWIIGMRLDYWNFFPAFLIAMAGNLLIYYLIYSSYETEDK